jgi:hypothetical protein
MSKSYLIECPKCELDLALTIVSYTPEEKQTWDYPGYPAQYEVGVVTDESECVCDYSYRDLDIYIDEVVEYLQDYE